MRAASVIAFVLAILGLSAAASAGLFTSGWEDRMEDVDKCYDKLKSDADVQFLERRISLSESPSIAQLSDEAVPTEEEVAIMQRGLNSREPCRQIYYNAVQKYHPYLRAAVDLRRHQEKLVYVELFKRRMAFGNASRLIEEAWLAFETRRAEYDRAQSEAQRRAIAESLDRMARQAQQPPPAFPGAGRVTCRWIGPTLYCDPY